jgi:hypothetical protein
MKSDIFLAVGGRFFRVLLGYFWLFCIDGAYMRSCNI